MKKSLPLELQKVWEDMWFGGNSREWRKREFILCIDYERELLWRAAWGSRDAVILTVHLVSRGETVVDDDDSRSVWDVGLK